MAERVGFEPTVPVLAAHTISSRVPSASSDISPRLYRPCQIRTSSSPPAAVTPVGIKCGPCRWPVFSDRLLRRAAAWRRGWDLNPRSRFWQDTAFRERRLQPLGHLSGTPRDQATIVFCIISTLACQSPFRGSWVTATASAGPPQSTRRPPRRR